MNSPLSRLGKTNLSIVDGKRQSLFWCIFLACAICGVLCISLPIPIIVNNFNKFYEKAKIEEEIEVKRKKTSWEDAKRGNKWWNENKKVLQYFYACHSNIAFGHFDYMRFFLTLHILNHRYIYFRYTLNKIRKNAVSIQNTHYEVNKFKKRLSKNIILDCADCSSPVIVFKTNFVLFCFFLQSIIVGLFSSIGFLFSKVSNDEVWSKLLYISVVYTVIHLIFKC